ncbi:hypothetical protein [Marinibactrum halimedae]
MLSGAVLSGAVLSGAVLSVGASLREREIAMSCFSHLMV